MVQDITAFRKISFQTVDVEVALAEIEYQYLKFICEATLRNSDEVLREQIRHLHIAGLPSFDDWRKQDTVDVRGILSPSIEAKTIPTTAIESSGSTAETTVEPQTESDRTAEEPPARKISQPKAKSSDAKPTSKTTDALLKKLSEPATAKLTSREVIEQEHEKLTVMLKEGKTMDDLATLLTSNGAKISASTLRNYLSAARRKAKAKPVTTEKKTASVVAASAEPTQSSEVAEPVAVEPAPSSAPQPTEPPIAEAAPASAIAEAAPEPTIAPSKPARGRPKAAAKSKSERETSVATSRARKQPSPLDVSPVPRRRKSRV